MPVRYKILLRRYDLATLNPSWRLEAGGAVQLFDWDDSGRITGRMASGTPSSRWAPFATKWAGWPGSP